MKPQQRILTGIQSSGKPHLGNALGAILPALELASRENARAFYFVADLHSLTSLPDAAERRENTLGVAAAWIAFGLDTSNHYLYRQSMIPEVCELTWYLSCYTPYALLQRSHSFKDKADNLEAVNTGLFIYPVLMAADILLYDAEIIPVGKDQKQHLEICRDIGRYFNNQYGEIFVIPEALIREEVMTIPGVDGRKMSKSYGNYIDIFAIPKEIEKQVMRIVTDSTPVEAPKSPDSCNVFKLFSLLGTEQQVAEMRQKYLEGGYGYGQAKKDLLKLVLERFEQPRQRFFELMAHRSELEDILRDGEARVREIGRKKLDTVRNCLGF